MVTRCFYAMRLKLLNGAPLCEHLDFSNEVLIAASESFESRSKERYNLSSQDNNVLKWRDIGFRRAPFRTGWSQPFLPGSGLRSVHGSHSFHLPGVEDTSDLPQHDATNLDTTITFDEELPAADEYLQHSLVFYDTLLSSQVVQEIGADDTVASSSFLTTSFGTTASGFSSPSPVDSQVPILQVPNAMAVTPLGSVPSAQHLRSIYPQTPTPNFLCVLMTTPERREVIVRKGGYKMDLWEITVGDDTRSNFKVTFWLRPPRNSNTEQNHVQVQLRHILELLQAGDIVLLRNIALTSFRDAVYGQSLNTAISRARTSVDVLSKCGGVSVPRVSGLPASAVDTFTRVKRWARSHVVGETNVGRKRKGGASRGESIAKRSRSSSGIDDDLPPDTMEAV